MNTVFSSSIQEIKNIGPTDLVALALILLIGFLYYTGRVTNADATLALIAGYYFGAKHSNIMDRTKQP